jgi:hypothetical protein
MRSLLLVVLLVAVLWLVSPKGTQGQFLKYEQAVHPYSGLDPASWQRFLNNMALFRNKLDSDIDLSAKALYTAVENVRDISLGIRHADDTVYQDRLNDIAGELGYEGEHVINEIALSKGVYFFPKYLNETIQEYPENAAGTAFVPSRVRSHGQ